MDAPRADNAASPRCPHGHHKTTTFIAGRRHDGVTVPLVIDGAMEGAMVGAIFLTYVKDFLCPTLQPGDQVIADNLGRHEVLLEAPPHAGHTSARPLATTYSGLQAGSFSFDAGRMRPRAQQPGTRAALAKVAVPEDRSARRAIVGASRIFLDGIGG